MSVTATLSDEGPLQSWPPPPEPRPPPRAPVTALPPPSGAGPFQRNPTKDHSTVANAGQGPAAKRHSHSQNPTAPGLVPGTRALTMAFSRTHPESALKSARVTRSSGHLWDLPHPAEQRAQGAPEWSVMQQELRRLCHSSNPVSHADRPSKSP